MTQVKSGLFFDEVMDVLSRFVDDENALVTADMNTRLIDDLDINSVRFVDIILEFEFKYDVDIDNDMARDIITIGDVVTLLESLIHKD